MPDIVEMVSNLGKQLVLTTTALATSGRIYTDLETYNKRFAVCGTCEHFIQNQSRCNICGCFMKTKAKLFAAKCPASKW